MFLTILAIFLMVSQKQMPDHGDDKQDSISTHKVTLPTSNEPNKKSCCWILRQLLTVPLFNSSSCLALSSILLIKKHKNQKDIVMSLVLLCNVLKYFPEIIFCLTYYIQYSFMRCWTVSWRWAIYVNLMNGKVSINFVFPCLVTYPLNCVCALRHVSLLTNLVCICYCHILEDCLCYHVCVIKKHKV